MVSGTRALAVLVSNLSSVLVEMIHSLGRLDGASHIGDPKQNNRHARLAKE